MEDALCHRATKHLACAVLTIMHSGGGYGAGRATTIRMLEDLKLNFDRGASSRA